MTLIKARLVVQVHPWPTSIQFRIPRLRFEITDNIEEVFLEADL
jgi:hypothetical protein